MSIPPVPIGYTVTIIEPAFSDEGAVYASVRLPDGRYTSCYDERLYCRGWHRTITGANRCGTRLARCYARMAQR